jgi:hypothetical protein
MKIWFNNWKLTFDFHFHQWEGSEVPYVMVCTKCGQTDYVGI